MHSKPINQPISKKTPPALSSHNCRVAGFTLAELLVVVAIVLVLVAIAIPVFTGALASAEEATCSANRRSVKSLYSVSYLLDQTQDSQTLFEKSTETLKEQNNGKLCPQSGEYSLDSRNNVDPEVIIIKCSIHGLELDEEMYTSVTKTFNGSWHTFQDDEKKKLTSDKDVRTLYASKNGLKQWPSVTGVDGKSLYLEFKSYGNSDETTFLYVGKNPDSTKTDWNADYICDNTGLVGEKGQWYQVNPGTGITGDEEKIRSILEQNEDSKVNFINGKFVKPQLQLS